MFELKNSMVRPERNLREETYRKTSLWSHLTGRNIFQKTFWIVSRKMRIRTFLNRSAVYTIAVRHRIWWRWNLAHWVFSSISRSSSKMTNIDQTIVQWEGYRIVFLIELSASYIDRFCFNCWFWIWHQRQAKS